jgi:hypothetical protein
VKKELPKGSLSSEEQNRTAVRRGGYESYALLIKVLKTKKALKREPKRKKASKRRLCSEEQNRTADLRVMNPTL